MRNLKLGSRKNEKQDEEQCNNFLLDVPLEDELEEEGEDAGAARVVELEEDKEDADDIATVVVGTLVMVSEVVSVEESVDVPGVLVATADSEVGEVGEVGKVGESVELVGLATDVSTTVVVDSEGDVGDSEVDSEVRVSWVMLVSVVIATLLESGAWVLVGTAVVSLPDCCLFAIWTIDVASSGSFARMASIAE